MEEKEDDVNNTDKNNNWFIERSLYVRHGIKVL